MAHVSPVARVSPVAEAPSHCHGEYVRHGRGGGEAGGGGAHFVVGLAARVEPLVPLPVPKMPLAAASAEAFSPLVWANNERLFEKAPLVSYLSPASPLVWASLSQATREVSLASRLSSPSRPGSNC